MKIVKIVTKVVLALLILCVLALTGISMYFYQVAVARTSKEFLQGNEDLETPVDNTGAAANEEWLETADIDEMDIISDDGLKLKAYYIPAEEKTNRTVILAHGYNGKGKDMVSFARFYHDTLGYNVLMPDDRGHGESDGTYIGFGWPDRKDYLKWIQLMISMNGEDTQIVLHGVSMGGATVLMVSGEEVPSNVKAIVSDCAYTSAEAQLSYQLERMYELTDFPILPATSLVTKIRAGYSFSEASALNQVQKTKIPVLFIHGDADTFVPYEMAEELYDACSSEKELYVVPGAGHGTAYRVAGEAYEQRVEQFIGRYIEVEEQE